MISPERYQRAVELFHAAVRLPREERADFLRHACPDDAELLREVESLLAHDAADPAAGGVIDVGRGAELLAGDLHADQDDDASAAGHHLPAQVGRYRIQRLVGQGGMGIIYEAEQDSPRRRVALKVLQAHVVNRPMLRRFQREAHLLGQLQHPGVAQVYEAGFAELNGGRQPYFAMEFIDGRPLDRHAESQNLSVREKLELLARVCDAVQHAHQKGIIHRDLKPANVLVVAQPEGTQATSGSALAIDGIGLPKVLDFGIARLTDADVHGATLQTEVGQLIGTLAYMSPEQVRGDSAAIDTRCDVYALGIMLYELLAGRRPHDLAGLPAPEAVRRLQEVDPPRLGALVPALRGDVETIVAKALEKDPERRYGSAAELAADIRRFLAAEPIQARPATTIYLMKRFATRHRVLVGGVAATILSLATGLVGVSWLAVREADARRVAEQAVYRSSLAAAGAALRQHDAVAAGKHLEGAPEALRGWEWGYLAAQLDRSVAAATAAVDPRIVAELSSYNECTNVWFHASGDIVQTIFAVSSTGFREHHIRAWKTDTMEPVSSWTIPDGIWPCPSADGTRVFVSHDDEPPQVLDALSGKVVGRFDPEYLPRWSKLKMIPRGMDSSFSWRRFAEPLGLDADAAIPRCEFSEDGSRAVIAVNGALKHVSTAFPGEAIILDEGEPYVRRPAMGISETPVWGISSDGRYVAEGGLDRSLRLYDTQDGGRLVWTVEAAHGVWVNVVAISPDARLIATGGNDRLLKIWDLRTGALQRQYVGSRLGIKGIAFHPDQRLVATTDGVEVRLWPIEADPAQVRIEGLRHLTISSDGAHMVTVGREAILWDMATGSKVCEIPGRFDEATAAAACFLGDTRLLVVHRDDRTGERAAQVIDLEAAAVAREFRLEVGELAWLPWRHLPELDLVATGDAQTPFLDATTFEPVRIPEYHRTTYAYGPGGRFATTRGFGGMVLLDGATLEPIRELATSAEPRNSGFTFASDGRHVAAPLPDGTIEILDVATGERVGALRGPAVRVDRLLSPAGTNRLVSSSADRTIRVWDLATMTLITEWRHETTFPQLYATPDGTTVLAIGGGMLHRWGPRADHELWAARAHYESTARMLTPTIDALLAEPGDPAGIADRLLAGATLSDRQRQIARQLLLRRALGTRQQPAAS